MWNEAKTLADDPAVAPRPPRRWSVIIMARAVTTGKVCSARDKCARRIDAQKSP
jgi:hypothetical protein